MAAPARWAATQTAAAELDGATRTGLLDAGAPMRITVALKMRDAAALDRFLARQQTLGDRQYGRTLAPQAFADRFAPSAAQVQAVTDYLAAAGFRDIEVAPNRLFVTATGRAADVRGAFRTELASFRHQGRDAFANTKPAQVPAALSGTVLSVLGLSNVSQVRPLLAVTPNAATTTGHNPVDFPKVYHVGTVGTASGTGVGIISAGDMAQTLADLEKYRSDNGFAAPSVSVVLAGPAGTDTSGTIEWDLDSQSILGMSGGVQQMVFYTGTSLALTDITLALNKAVTDNVVKAVNVSLGTCEKNFKTSGDMAADDQIFQAGIAQGITFFVSSGDAGANTGCSSLSRTGLTKQVSYPSSSPYVVAVGGTTLSTDSSTGAYASEKAWSKSGGGKSVYETAPSWQQALAGPMRGVPDVSFTADPNSGAILVTGTTHTQVGGTSLSSPLMAAVWARLESVHGNTLGFAAPKIYAGYAASKASFHDVTSGSNNVLLGGYSAAAGYDFVTGLGSLDVQSFAATLP